MAKNRSTSNLHWVRAGQQLRSQKTQESLLQAAASLFAEKGIEATSVVDVATEAGSSVGSMYHHFRDKKTLLHAVFARMATELQATTQAAVDPARWEAASIADVLRGYLEFSLEVGRNRPAIKAAGKAAARSDPALGERLAELQAELDEGLARLLLARRAEIRHSNPALAIAFVLGQCSSMLTARLDGSRGANELTNRSDGEFVHEALRSASAYLQLDGTLPRREP